MAGEMKRFAWILLAVFCTALAHVQPVDAWYVIPIEKVGRAKSLRLYPGIESRNPRWEQWRDRWDLLGKR